MRPVRAIGLLALLLSAPSCDRTTTEPVMSRETFVEVVVALRRAAVDGPSVEEFEARKAQILAEAGVTDSLLVTYVRSQRNARDLAELWELVNEELSAEDDEGDEGDEDRDPGRIDENERS
jgi:hypothetical protein